MPYLHQLHGLMIVRCQNLTCVVVKKKNGGEDGIRTHGPAVNRTRDFQSRLFGHSSTSPKSATSDNLAKEFTQNAERVGFEPTMRLLPYRFSRPAPSAARPPLPASDYSMSHTPPTLTADRPRPILLQVQCQSSDNSETLEQKVQ